MNIELPYSVSFITQALIEIRACLSDNFLLNNNPTDPLYYKFNTYYVPTDFQYVGLKTQRGHGWNLDVKPYAYS